ncbi:MAG: hypothetical protein ACI9YE_002702 [Psychroserpens sp.]|jgi:hypothetical protein
MLLLLPVTIDVVKTHFIESNRLNTIRSISEIVTFITQ